MKRGLPPLACQGAELLTGGSLRAGVLGLANGRIARPGGTSVDLSGFALLPGAVDMGGARVSGPPAAKAVQDHAAAAARAGTTSLWVGVDWPERPGAVAETRGVLAALGAIAADLPVDLRIRLSVSTHGVATSGDLLEALPSLSQPLLMLRHAAPARRAAVEDELGGAGALARHLCSLASAFDDLGLRYGTEADPDGETRERFSMIGARMALRPAARGAAASARAYAEPVVLAASDILDGAEIGCGLGALLLAEGLCDALGAFGDPGGPRKVVKALVDSGRMPLGHAWALISSAPAGILRRADRGGLVEGTRADIAIVDPSSLAVAGTIAGGVLVHCTPDLLDRFRPVLARDEFAAE
ncbi:MAG: hypothetical protein QNJ13_05910 [Paracoccaceae bacterium]|nr:hypothetical protein [Paracoccaceae bacterium]